MTAPAVCGFLAVLLAADAGDLVHVDVFTSGDGGYHTYRIPAIVAAPGGVLVAFCEGRKYNAADPGHGNNDIDLVYKRSTDCGRTWSAMKVLEDPGEKWSAANPAAVFDRRTGRLWVLYLRSRPGRSTTTSRPGTDDMLTLARWSGDSGAQWSEAIDISRAARDWADPEWRASVVGPGGMIQDRRGRLLAPVWKAPYNVFVLMSEDGGRTWKRGGFPPGGTNGDECQLVELADGRLLLDARQVKGPHRLRWTSSDGGHSWKGPFPGERVTPCACAIERLTLAEGGRGRNRIIWTGPRGPGRRTLVVRVSYDEGMTFGGERVIYDGLAAYSDLTALGGGRAGVLWERGGYKWITWTVFDLEWLEGTGGNESRNEKKEGM